MALVMNQAMQLSRIRRPERHGTLNTSSKSRCRQVKTTAWTHTSAIRGQLIRIIATTLASFGAVSTHAATVTTIDTRPMAGYPSLAIGVDGMPVIAYQTLDNKLIVATCQNWDCSERQRIELTGDYQVAKHFALTLTPGGHPAVAYKDAFLGDLEMVKCVTADCNGGGHVFHNISGFFTTGGTNVDFAYGADNHAVFAYQREVDGDLMLARCADTTCETDDIETTIIGDGEPPLGVWGGYIGMTFRHNGFDPVIASQLVFSAGQEDERPASTFLDCQIEPCEDSLAFVDGHSSVGHIDGPVGVSMAIGPGDRPMFAHSHVDNDEVHFTRCRDADCSGGVDRAVLDDGSFTLGFDDNTSIGVRQGGRPVIAYQKAMAVFSGQTALYVAECADAACSSVHQVQIERSPLGEVTGLDAELAIDHDGNVVIAYYDQSAQSIKLARCGANGCEGPGDRIFSDAFD